MDSSHIPLIVVIVLLIVASAYFSATETAFSSLNRVRMKNLAAAGNRRAALTLTLAEQYDKLLSTILIGNNIVNICSASIATVLFVAWFPNAGVTLSTVVMTVLVLIFGEISPKSLAKDAPEQFAMFSAPILRVLLVLLAPLNVLFTQWKKLLRRIFPAKPDPGITEEDLLTIVEEAESDGALGAQEGALIRSAIEFNDLDVIDVFTPRVAVCALEDTSTTADIAAAFAQSGFSRLPVYHENPDQIIGILHEKDFYSRVLTGGEPVAAVLKAPLFIPPSLRISDLLRLFQKQQTHLAVITDEYGGIAGIVTIEDILEELVGEIWDEHDEVNPEIEPLSTGGCQVQGGVRLEKLFEVFDLDAPETDLSTVNGWALSQLDNSPRTGDSFESAGLRFTVLRTNGRYISLLQVEPVCENVSA